MFKSRKLIVPLVAFFVFASGVVFAADEIHWTILGQTSVGFDWRGADGSVGEQTIRWGTSPGTYTFSALGAVPDPWPDSSAGPFWEAALTGLSQDTTYYYTIGNSTESTFRTPPAPGTSDFWFSQQADVGAGVSGQYPLAADVQDDIAADNASIPGDDRPRFLLLSGDISYADDKGISAVDNHFNMVMRWSRWAAYMVAWGNHDDGGADGRDEYEGRFIFPNPQDSPNAPADGGPGEEWYWFDYGNVRFISYPEPYSGAWADWNTRAGLIMAAAQSDPNITFIVTWGHRPPYSWGLDHGSDPAIQSILNGFKTQYSKYVLNISGHSHHYERSIPAQTSGVLYVTGGGGGGTLGGLQASPPSWSALRINHHHHIKMRVTASAIQGYVVCGPDGGNGANPLDPCPPDTVIDTWTITAPGGNQAPNGTFDTPAGPTTITVGQSVSFTGTGSDPENNLPLTYLWNFGGGAANSTLEDPGNIQFNAAGEYNVIFTVTDSLGLPDASPDSRVITVNAVPDTTAPTVSVTAPAESATVSGNSVTVSATASDPESGIASVQFMLDGTTSLGTDSSPPSPYSITWDTTTAINGAHTLTVVATNGASLTTTSAGVGVTVDNTAPSTLTFAPTDDTTIKFDSPDNNFGADTTLNLKGGSTGIPPQIRDLLFKFTVIGVVDSISSAVLNLWLDGDDSNVIGPSIGGTFWPVPNNSWSESTVTWNTAPASTTPVIGMIPGQVTPINRSTPFSVDLTSYITGNGTYSIRVGNTNTTNGLTYFSQEYTTDPTRQPQLVLTLVPAGDTTPPVRSSGQPSGILPAGTGTTALTLITDENATCAHSTTAGTPYGSMTQFVPTTGGLTHSETISVADDTGYTYYVRCINAALIVNPDDHEISFSVAANQAPNGTIDTPAGPATITAGDSVSFTGTGLDPEPNLPLTYLWNFNGGAANSTLENPGNIQFNAAGEYNVTFTVTDSLGLPDSSPDSRVITVNPVPDSTAPTVSISAPTEGATVSGSVTVSATASDPESGITSIQIKLDGTVIGTGGSSPYSVSWNTTGVSDGNHTLTAVATNGVSLNTTSAGVGVTVDNGGGGPSIPSVSAQAPSLNDGGDSGLYETGTDLSIIPDSAGFCPSGMMWVPLSGGFCIDRYEAYDNAGSAGSSPNQTPWNTISFAAGGSACTASGKRLPTREEWLIAAFGTPEPAASPTACTWGGAPANTGTRSGCKSSFGMYDMIGNVAEWTSDSKVRGGSYNNTGAASRSLEVPMDPLTANDTIGFRCVR